MNREMNYDDVEKARALASHVCVFLSEGLQVDCEDPIVMLGLCNLIAAYVVEMGGGEDMLLLCHKATVEAHRSLSEQAKLMFAH